MTASQKSSDSATKKIVILGGQGGMGRVFQRELSKLNYNVVPFEKDDWDRYAEIFEGADLVILSVPIGKTMDIIEDLRGKLPENVLLTDFTSIKTKPIAKMREVHPGPVLGLHPMFGPTTSTLVNQIIIDCGGRRHHAFDWFKQDLVKLGARLVKATADEHDRMMALVQVARHFTSFAYGVHLFEENANLERMMEFSSPIYRLEMGMVGRLFAQNPNLYAEIIFNSEHGKKQLRDYALHYQEMVRLVEENKKEEFIEYFQTVSSWFGNLSKQFLDESTHVIDQLIEYSKPESA